MYQITNRQINIEQIITSQAFIAITLFFAFFLNLWGVPLFDLDEGAFSEATREMLASGNFAATYLDGVPRYDKPILSYWFQAISISIFGLNEFAVRLPSAIAATLWLLASYRFVKAQWDQKTAAIVILFMANTLWIGLIGRAAIADAWLNLFISLAIFDIWRYFQHSDKRILWRTYLWLGLGILTKGPVALIIPLLSSGLFFAFQGQTKRWFGAITHPIGWAIMLVVLCPWLWLVYQAQGIDFFYGFLIEHNVNRFASTREGHGGQWYYFLVVLPLILLPFSGALFALIRSVKSQWTTPLSQFMLIWLVVVFVLVSLSQTQLPHYVLYGATGSIILFAANRDSLMNSNWQLLFPIGFFMLLLSLPWLLPFAATNTERLYEKALLERADEIFTFSYIALAILALGLALFFSLQKQWPVWQRLICIGTIQTLFMFNVFVEKVADLQQQPVKEAALIAKQHAHKQVVAYKIRMPSFSVYRQDITPRTPPNKGDLIFTRIDRIEQLNQSIPSTDLNILYQKGGILLLEYTDD